MPPPSNSHPPSTFSLTLLTFLALNGQSRGVLAEDIQG